MKVLGVLDLNGNQIINVDVTIDGVENDIVKIDSNGNIVDSGVSISDLTPIPNIIESISVNNTPITPVNKNVNIDLSGYAETANLATVATSGDYTDLNNTPDLAAVATSGDYDDLQNKPDMSSFITETDVYGMGFAMESELDSYATKNEISDFVSSSDLSTVATSGDYEDLDNKPDMSEYVTSSDLATVATSGSYTDLEDTPDMSEYVTSSDLATVATSGSYTDLQDTPDFETFAAIFKAEVTDSETSGQQGSYTIDVSYVNCDDAPIVQTVYNNKIVYDGIEITVGGSNNTINIAWDSTKYDVSSNNPLLVTIIGSMLTV